MKKLVLPAMMLAVLMAPMASLGAEHPAKENAKLAATASVEGLAPKNTISEPSITYACAAGQAGGVALSLLLGSSKAWDALADAVMGNPPNAQQQAFCAFGQALAPHALAAAESVAQMSAAAYQDHITSAQRQADKAKSIMASRGAQMQQAWSGLVDLTAEKSAKASGEAARFCQGSATCSWLSDKAAMSWGWITPRR